ncbi:MAG: DEAD/DEAH box helicase, partial [Clostridia bacterium]|nr:DEAD/DEAH box helicase [Clostridia bacterium]
MADCTRIHEKHIWDIWSWMKPESLRPVQSVLDTYLSSKNEMPVLMILEAPMGEGKTEAGIYAALQMAEYWTKNGLYIGLPTAATSNQMHNRVNSLLETHHIGAARLLHSMAWLEETDDTSVKDADNEYSDWLKPSKRALLSPWAVGTVDQVLMSVLRVKYGVLRLLGLFGKVLVLDEIHAYDAYMSSIIKRLLEWCKVLKIPVVMLSATLPEEKRAELLAVYTSDT